MPIEFEYTFRDEQGEEVDYRVELDPKTLLTANVPSENLPTWSRLETHRCEHCPLSQAQYAHCPVAANISGVVEAFQHAISYDRVTVTVSSPERTYVKEVDLQHGLCSLLGLLMATSDCPHMEFLRPLARFHLPFASPTETLMRTVSFFLLRQYLGDGDESPPQLDLSELEAAYHNVNVVNRGIARRIQSYAHGDADANAVISWHAVASILMNGLSEKLPEIRALLAMGRPRSKGADTPNPAVDAPSHR